MAEIVIIIRSDRSGVIEGLRMKMALEKIGMEIAGVITKKTGEGKVPVELIESFMKLKVIDNFEPED